MAAAQAVVPLVDLREAQAAVLVVLPVLAADPRAACMARQWAVTVMLRMASIPARAAMAAPSCVVLAVA
jgi:hypothetical protein